MEPEEQTPNRLRDSAANELQSQEVEHSQALLNSIINSTTDMIWSVNPNDFGLLMFNRSLYDYFLEKRGISIKIGMRPEDLYRTDAYVQLWHGFYQRAIEEGSYASEYRTSSGADTLLVSINAIKQANKIVGLSVVGKDITERKHAEELIHESEERFRGAFEQAAVGMSHIAPDGRLLRVNQRFSDILGYSQQELLGLRFQDFIYPQDLALNKEYTGQLLAGTLATFAQEKRYMVRMARWCG
jgi:PAS domain S-box-containing protein